jgi:hypothetical protein
MLIIFLLNLFIILINCFFVEHCYLDKLVIASVAYLFMLYFILVFGIENIVFVDDCYYYLKINDSFAIFWLYLADF